MRSFVIHSLFYASVVLTGPLRLRQGQVNLDFLAGPSLHRATQGPVDRQGRSIEDAKDLTQGFFTYVLERNLLSRADPAKGKKAPVVPEILLALQLYVLD